MSPCRLALLENVEMLNFNGLTRKKSETSRTTSKLGISDVRKKININGPRTAWYLWYLKDLMLERALEKIQEEPNFSHTVK